MYYNIFIYIPFFTLTRKLVYFKSNISGELFFLIYECRIFIITLLVLIGSWNLQSWSFNGSKKHSILFCCIFSQFLTSDKLVVGLLSLKSQKHIVDTVLDNSAWEKWSLVLLLVSGFEQDTCGIQGWNTNTKPKF